MSEQHVLILGGGIMGICIANALLESNQTNGTVRVTMVETTSIACAASGKAGGFISRDWPEATSLALLSWKEHCRLAADHGNSYGWRESGAIGLRVGSVAVSRSAYRALPNGTTIEGDSWLNGEREDMSSASGGIAQLEPALFAQTMYARCVKMGLITYYAHAIDSTSSSVTFRSNDTPTRVFSLPFDHLVIAAGPWSAALCARLHLHSIPVTNLPGHSILIRPFLPPNLTELPSDAIFAGIGGGELGVHASTSGAARNLSSSEIAAGFTTSPELFPRSNGLVYVAGENSIPRNSTSLIDLTGEAALPNRLPSDATGVDKLLDRSLIQRLQKAAARVSPHLDVGNGAVIEKEQFCYRPVHTDGLGLPIVGRLSKNVYVATAHGPWGITLAPGTGLVMSELILGTKLSCDISTLAVHRKMARSLL